jgi:hypothetical protein
MPDRPDVGSVGAVPFLGRYHPPRNIAELFTQKGQRGRRFPSPLPSLQTFLRTFVSPQEMGYRFLHTKDKPRWFLKTETLNERVAAKNRADFLTGFELNLHYRHHDRFRLYYVNRGDSHHIYPYVDVDNQPHRPGGDSQQAVGRLLAHFGINAHHSPTTNGWCFYPCVDVRLLQPGEINAALNRFADRCNQLTASWGLRVKVEAKALPSITSPITGQVTKRGVLGRLPRFESEEEYSEFIGQQAIPLALLAGRASGPGEGHGSHESSAATSAPVPAPGVQRKPRETPRRAGFGANRGPGNGKGWAKTTQPTPAEQPDAFQRMLGNGYHYGEIHRSCPNPQQLLEHYNAGPSASDDDSNDDRAGRASRVSAFLATRWKQQAGPPSQQAGASSPPSLSPPPVHFSGPPGLGAAGEKAGGASGWIDIERYVDQLSQIPMNSRNVKISRSAKRVRYCKMDPYELGLVVAVVTHNFGRGNHRTPRMAVENLWRACHTQGLVGRSWKNEYYTAAMEVLTATGWLEIIVPDNRGHGRARTLCPGPCHPEASRAQALRSELLSLSPPPVHLSGTPNQQDVALGVPEISDEELLEQNPTPRTDDQDGER